MSTDREARLGLSLKRLDHRLVSRPAGGFAIADLSGKVVSGAGKVLSLEEVESWIKDYIKPRA